MRNLKKVLSLALALVMLVGMMVVGAGATSFADDASIQNQEAVSVLAGLGVVKGRNDGSSFDPTGTLTRAEAAMMIAQLDLGVDAAAALKANGINSFTDVATTHWAVGAIDYCVEQGYIRGDGNNHFFPGNNVTGVEFGIMLTSLLGYDADAEGVTGAQWATKGAALARRAGLTDGVAASNSPMTRDGMAQMAFNALTADMVEYDNAGTSIDLGGIGSITVGTKAEKVMHTQSATQTTYDKQSLNNAATAAATPVKLCEVKFPTLKLDNASSTSDELNRPAQKWEIDGTTVYTKTAAADYSIVVSKSGQDTNYWANQAKKNMTTNAAVISVNGATAADNAGVGNLLIGDVVEFYNVGDTTANVADTVVVSRYVLDKITDVDTDVSDSDAEDGVSCYVDFGATDTHVNDTDIPGFNADSYVKGTYVAVCAKTDGTILDSYIPADIEDNITTKKGTTEITVGGKKYTASGSIASASGYTAVSAVTVGKDATYTVYLDKNEFVLGIVEVEAAAATIDDVYYLDTVWKTAGGMAGDNYHAQLVSLAGEKSEVALEKVDHSLGGNSADLSNSAYDSGYGALNGLLVTVSDKKVGSTSKAGNDLYNLTVWAPSADWSKVTISAGNLGVLKKDTRTVTTGGNSYRLNSATVYLFMESSNVNLAVTRYEGGVAYDTTQANALTANKSYIITEKNKNLAKYVIICTADAGQVTEYSSDVVFISSASTTVGDGYREQEVYLPDGTKDTWNVKSDEYTTGGALHSFGGNAFFTYSETDGVYSLNAADAISTSNATGSAIVKDWPTTKDAGTLNGVTLVKGGLFENMLTVTAGSGTTLVTFGDINVADAEFVDLHSTTTGGQYDKAVKTLAALDSLLTENKVDAATLYMNITKDGAVTIFATSVTEHVGSFSAGTKDNDAAITVGGTGKTAVDWTASSNATTVALNGLTLSVTLDTNVTYTVTFETDYSGDENTKVAVDATGTGGFAAVLTAAKTKLQAQIDAANTSAAAGTSNYTKYEDLKLTGANKDVTGTVDKTPQTYA